MHEPAACPLWAGGLFLGPLANAERGKPTPLRLTPPAATQVSLPSRLREGLGVGRPHGSCDTIAHFPITIFRVMKNNSPL